MDVHGALVAMANIISDLLAPSVFHVCTFIVATERHGNGDAQVLYAGLEQWAARNGAAWLRLGEAAAKMAGERHLGHAELAIIWVQIALFKCRIPCLHLPTMLHAI